MSNLNSGSHDATPNYNLEIPVALSHPQLAGVIALGLATALYSLIQNNSTIAISLISTGLVLSIFYIVLFFIVKRFTNLPRRLRARDELINEILWQGDEKVLDVGCGNGILTFAAAKHLTTGNVIGIDIWLPFAGESCRQLFVKNSKIEGVYNKVSLANVDVRRLPYDDNTFDIIICGLSLHHISHGEQLHKAMSEITRVLRPGGCLAIYDIPPVIFSCARLMKSRAFEVHKKNRNMVFAKKPI